MVTSHQIAVLPGTRDAWVEIDLNAIRSNLELIKSWLCMPSQDAGVKQAQAQIMGVVKSDAYGHGAEQVGEVLVASGATWLAVASVDEGIELRKRLPHIPILILSPTPDHALLIALQHDLDITVTNSAAVQQTAAAASALEICGRVHLKVDSGMHRLGCPATEARTMVDQIRGFQNLKLVSVFSHLAKPGEELAVSDQLNAFENALQIIRYADVSASTHSHLTHRDTDFMVHLASSEATKLFPQTHFDLVRVGLYLYGLESRSASEQLTPAMSLKGRINQVIEIAEGESVGYGFTWTAKRATRLANIPIGYADGVDRGLSNRISALLLGREIQQVGTISMDMMVFDITDVPEARQGDVVTLIGEDGEHIRRLADWAQALDTITYELACRLRIRLPRRFIALRASNKQTNTG